MSRVGGGASRTQESQGPQTGAPPPRSAYRSRLRSCSSWALASWRRASWAWRCRAPSRRCSSRWGCSSASGLGRSFGLVLTSAIHFVGPHRAMTVSGMLNAAAGLVGFALSPALQATLQAVGTAGALLSGWLSSRVPKGRLLAFYYGFRAVWVALFVFAMPKTLACAVAFSVGLGLTGDATVSPTSGLVNEQLRIEYVATLVGTLFLCHQVGAFMSAWLGGILLDATVGYEAVWAIDVAACAFACVMSARIPAGRRALTRP